MGEVGAVFGDECAFPGVAGATSEEFAVNVDEGEVVFFGEGDEAFVVFFDAVGPVPCGGRNGLDDGYGSVGEAFEVDGLHVLEIIFGGDFLGEVVGAEEDGGDLGVVLFEDFVE